MLLVLAGVDKSECAMIQARIQIAHDFGNIADTLGTQHPRVHLERDAKGEGCSARPKGTSKGTGTRYSSKSRRAWRNLVGFVNLAAETLESLYDVA